MSSSLDSRDDLARLLFTHSPDAIVITDNAGVVVEANPAAAALFGYELEQLPGRAEADLCLPESPTSPTGEHETESGECTLVRPDQQVWIASYSAYRLGPNRRVRIFSDITARKRTEEQLQQSEEEFRAFVTASADIVYKMSPDWREMRYLQGQDFLASTEHPTHTWLEEYIPLSDQPQIMEGIEEIIRTKIPFEMEHRVIRRDGTIGWTLSRAIPLLDSNQEVREWLGAASDITARKRREIHRTFLDTLLEEVTASSTAAELIQVFGQRIHELLGASVCTFVEINPAQDAAIITDEWRRREGQSLLGSYDLSQYVTDGYREAMAAGRTTVVRDITKDPHIHDKDRFAALRIGSFINVPLLRDGTWRFALGVYHEHPYNWASDEIELIVEITNRLWNRLERVRAEEALRASEEKYRTLFMSMDEGLLIAQVLFDTNGEAVDYLCQEVNAAFYVHTGLQGDVVGMTMREIAPDTPIPWLPIYGQVVHTQEPVRFEFDIEMEQLRGYYDVHILPLGEPHEHRVAVIFQNITERNRAKEASLRHQAEIESLNTRLRRAMQETHHRIKNNLQIIAALVEIQGLRDAPVGESTLRRINTHVRSLATIHDLLTQQAKTDTDLTDLNAKAMLDRLIPLLQSTSGGRHFRYAAEDIPLPVSQSAALALLVNELVSNAIKHGRGEIEITLQFSDEAPTGQEADDVRWARLEVSDYGPGFPDGFDPQQSASTGLELIESAARWDLKGTLSYENRPEGGGRIVVVFPVPGNAAPVVPRT